MFLNKVSVKIALTFTIFSTAVSILVFSALSILIVHLLEDGDKRQMERQLHVLETKYYQGGLNRINSGIDISNMLFDGKPYFIRIQKGVSVFDIGPTSWKHNFDYSQLNDLESGTYTVLTCDEFEYDLYVLTYMADDGTIFQTGVSDQQRRQFIQIIEQVFIILVIPLIIVSMLFGLWYARNTLRPVMILTDDIRNSIEHGKREQKLIRYSNDDELGELVNLYSTLSERNENLIKGMKETLDNVSHDLRTPLTRIRGVAEVALTSNNPEAMGDALADSIEEIDSIIKILNALLDITASENGVLKLDKREFDLKDLMERSCELYDFIAEDKMLKLLLKYNFGSNTYFGDEIKIRQAIANVLDNAVKYSDKGGVIDIEVFQDEGALKISVKDSGIGISEEELDNIFDRLYRSTRSRNEPGLGLGLSMVRAIITAHDGFVDVESTPGEGSTFVLTLPLQNGNDEVII